MSTVTWLMGLHLFFTYAPKAVDMMNGLQQFAQHQKIGITNAAVNPANPRTNRRRNGKRP